MTDIYYIDRQSKKKEKEKVYGRAFIEALYGNGVISKIFSFFFLPLVAKVPLFSRLYGLFQSSKWSKPKVSKFINAFAVDPKEFLESPTSYGSFNDFFIRKLHPEARPICQENTVAVMPADARYLFYPHIEKSDGFLIKGEKFSLSELLQDGGLAETYRCGAMVIARLCPTDYHRFHFPCSCVPDKPKLINGPLYSVNPLALKKNIHILCQNKRMLTKLHTKNFGTILYIEVGATYVGSIHQSFIPHESYAKGEEKGYFSFGGSSLNLLFEPNKICFDQDLLDISAKKIEVRALLGQSMGSCLNVV